MNTGDVWVAGVHLWDVASGRFLRRIPAHQGWIDSLDFSPDGRTLATTGIEVVVRVWSVADGREVVPQVGHRTAINHLVVATDGRTVFTAGLDGTVREWDAASGRDRGIFARFPGYIHGMAVAPNGKSLVVSALFDGVTLRDVAGRRLVRRFEHDEPESPVHGLAFAPDGRTLVSGPRPGTWRPAGSWGRSRTRIRTGGRPRPIPASSSPPTAGGCSSRGAAASRSGTTSPAGWSAEGCRAGRAGPDIARRPPAGHGRIRPASRRGPARSIDPRLRDRHGPGGPEARRARGVLGSPAAFAPSLDVFLIMRACFGVAMGGEWGVGAALAFETLPKENRGFFSGLLQEGYVVGWDIKAGLAYATLPPHVGWRGMFIVGALPRSW